MGGTNKRSIIGRDTNSRYEDWNCHTEKSMGTRVFLNRLVWVNSYTQAVNSPTRGVDLLEVYLVRPESSFTSRSNVQGISEHCGVLLAIEWGENYREYQVERLIPVYHKTKATGLQSFPRGRFASWATNRRCVEKI